MDLKIEKLWNKLIKDSFDVERNMSALHRKQTGSYYTGLNLAYEMMKELICEIQKNESVVGKRFLEPCVGTGNFVFAYLRACFDLHLSAESYKKILDDIYVCDINKSALTVYKENLIEFAKDIFDLDLDDDYFNSHIGGGLLVDIDTENIEYISIDKIFDEKVVRNGFDIVATNPPYKNLKAETTHYDSEEEKERDREKYKIISVIGKRLFPFSSYGTLNLYKMFVEEIIEKYLNSNGYCSLLIPSSILSDKNCSQLRTRIIKEYSLKSIYMIPETSNVIDASQALCAMLLAKKGETNKIKIKGQLKDSSEFEGISSIDDIIDECTGNSILVLSPEELRTKKTMEKCPRLKEIHSIKNLRGELDITFHKNCITNEPTIYSFYRGRNIGFYKAIELEEREYVTPEFINQCAKSKYIKNKRLACQQIANMSKSKRVAYAIVNENTILGNSCNFIAVEDENVDLFFLLGVLNSKIIEWYFKLTSSNNHVNNYEIDNFPIPINSKNTAKISELVKMYLASYNDEILDLIETEVKIAYGIEE